MLVVVQGDASLFVGNGFASRFCIGFHRRGSRIKTGPDISCFTRLCLAADLCPRRISRIAQIKLPT